MRVWWHEKFGHPWRKGHAPKTMNCSCGGWAFVHAAGMYQADIPGRRIKLMERL